MIEMDYYARISGLSTDAFLDRCMAAGLESCPGGGAEIFDEALREQICIGKKDAQVWLDTARDSGWAYIKEVAPQQADELRKALTGR